MIRSLCIVGLWLVSVGAFGEPLCYSPSVLVPGALVEVYGFDALNAPRFSVEVVRESSGRVLARSQAFTVSRPLGTGGPPTAEWKWAAALVALDAFEAPGTVVVRFLRPDKTVLAEKKAVVGPRAFPIEVLPLDAAMSDLRQKPDARKDREAALIWSHYEKFDPDFPWGGGHFRLPVSGPLSAHFGDTREYLYADGTTARDYHRGADFAVPVGTRVVAPAAGRVVLSADRLLTGITLVVEHAPGVYSVYFHLSRALVPLGRSVAAGDLIALSGATGFVTGPHLHWEVRVGGVPVDPFDLVDRGLLDTAVVSKVVSSFERPIH